MFWRSIVEPSQQSPQQWSLSLYDSLFPADGSVEVRDTLLPVYLELVKRMITLASDSEKASIVDHVVPAFLGLLNCLSEAGVDKLITLLPLLVEANSSFFEEISADFLRILRDVQNPRQSVVLKILSSFSQTSLAADVLQCLHTQIQCTTEEYLKGSIPDLSILKHVFSRLQYYAMHFPDTIDWIVEELKNYQASVTSQILAEITKHAQDEFFDASLSRWVD